MLASLWNSNTTAREKRRADAAGRAEPAPLAGAGAAGAAGDAGPQNDSEPQPPPAPPSPLGAEQDAAAVSEEVSFLVLPPDDCNSMGSRAEESGAGGGQLPITPGRLALSLDP